MRLLITILFIAQISYSQTIGINNTYEFTATNVFFKTPSHIYFSVMDTVYKAPLYIITKMPTDVTEYPETTLNYDMYMFTKKGKQAVGLYVAGGILSLIGTGVAVANFPIAGAGIMFVGSIFSISGFITNATAWKIGYKMGVKQYAIDYSR